jgi:hypothetical protein
MGTLCAAVWGMIFGCLTQTFTKKYTVTFLFLASTAFAETENNVILITFDGVRWQDVYHEPSNPLVQLKRTVERKGFRLGDHRIGSRMFVANPFNISLPAYESIFAGAVQPCDGNDCPRTSVETLQERLVRELHLPKSQVATIASWDKIAFAAEHLEGSTFVNTGLTPLDDGENDPELQKLNEEQSKEDLDECRMDRFTWAQGMRYLKVHRPRFLYISLDDTDAWAHGNHRDEYLQSLKNYDQWLQNLFAQLKAMGEYGRHTTVLITTDHGRGLGARWTDHGPDLPSSHSIWLMALSPKTRTGDAVRTSTDIYTHLDIRPTIEKILGLKPEAGPTRGRPIQGIE